MWIASLNEDNQLVEKKHIRFNAGDLLILPFGTIHAGDKNRHRKDQSYKLFTEVYTTKMTDSSSQLWIHEGMGYTGYKKAVQNPRQDHDHSRSSKKRKRDT